MMSSGLKQQPAVLQAAALPTQARGQVSTQRQAACARRGVWGPHMGELGAGPVGDRGPEVIIASVLLAVASSLGSLQGRRPALSRASSRGQLCTPQTLDDRCLASQWTGTVCGCASAML